MSLNEQIRKAKRVYLIGNGGSYANAIHIANDLIACGIKAYILDPASLTACANDYGFENVFARWLKTVGEKEDLLIALSGSGKSVNILRAINAAHLIGMDIWCEFGAAKGLDMQQAEEAQLHIGHDFLRDSC